MEAVTWAMEKIGGVTTRKDGVELLQMLVKEQLVLHASLDLNIPFLDGFLFYCVPKRMKQEGKLKSYDISRHENLDFFLL